MKLIARLSLRADAARPRHDRAVARPAVMRGDLFGPLIRRAERVRPADRVVIVGFRRSEVADPAEKELRRLDAGHSVEHRHFVEAAVDGALARSAVIAD